MTIEAYLFFEGRCEEAMDFYRHSLGAEMLSLMRYGDSPEAPPPDKLPPGSQDKVMHGSMRLNGSTLMLSDGLCSGRPSFDGFNLSIGAPDLAGARGMFDALSDGGTVRMPLAPTFWSPGFGMVTDRFGVGWMVSVSVSP